MQKKMAINLAWNVRIDDTMVFDSIAMTTCMSPFSQPLLDFDSMPKISTLTNMHFYKCCSCIYIFRNFTLEVIVVKVALSNKS
jgi:hypothetical protein